MPTTLSTIVNCNFLSMTVEDIKTVVYDEAQRIATAVALVPTINSFTCCLKSLRETFASLHDEMGSEI